MFSKHLFLTIGAIWCCVPEQALPWDRAWPLHKALVDLDNACVARGSGYVLSEGDRPAFCDEAGIGVPSLRSVLVQLVRKGFTEIGSDRHVRLTSSGRFMGAAVLMRCPLELSEEIQKAAGNWATLASTSAKKLAAAV